jgi:4'-phosphopantetheinyl transferase
MIGSVRRGRGCTSQCGVNGEDDAATDDALSRWSLPADSCLVTRRRSLLARALLRERLVRAAGLSHGWNFGSEESGRPFVRNPDSNCIPSISLSHSGGWVACAVSYSGAIGIDIEVHRPKRNLAGIAATAFGPDEQSEVVVDGASAFYRIWTLKEAMAKASGIGVAQVADRVDRVPKTPKTGAWRMTVGGTPWWLAYTTPVSALSLAVAIRDPD